MSDEALRNAGAQLVRSCLLISETLLMYDYLCTFDREIELVWTNPSSPASLMFFANRYLPFIDTILNINVNFSESLSAEQCLLQSKAVIWLMFAGMTISELILMLRTYAIWERKRSILIFFILLTIGVIVPAIVFTWKEAVSLQFESVNGCHATAASNIIFLAYCLLTMYEIVIVVLVIIKAHQHMRQTRTRWVIKLYKDGILFYVYLLVLSIGNIVSSVIGPILGPWLQAPQRIIHSIICTRVLFFILQRSSPNQRPSLSNRNNDSAITTTTLELDVLGENSELPVFFLSRSTEEQTECTGGSMAGCHIYELNR